LGDHLYQDSTLFPPEFRIHKLPSKYEESYFSEKTYEANSYLRRPVNIFINSLLDRRYVKNRDFSHFDIYPALIDSIGGIYDAAGFGLGRSMSKGEQTLIEKLGINNIEQNLRRRSELYNALYQK
jgi:phosphoglycerol transferase